MSGNAWQVVGVIADVVDRRLDVPHGAFAYVPSAFNMSQISVIVRTPLDPMSLVARVRAEVARLDPGVAVASPRALDRAMVCIRLTGTAAQSSLRVSATPLRYERRLPGGTVEVYALSDGAPAGQRRVLMTELIDPLGQSLQFTWDSQARLVAITDAIGYGEAGVVLRWKYAKEGDLGFGVTFKALDPDFED